MADMTVEQALADTKAVATNIGANLESLPSVARDWHQRLVSAEATLRAEIERLEKDSRRIDALAQFLDAEDGLVLHIGKYKGNYSGLSARPGFRSLREALDSLSAQGASHEP